MSENKSQIMLISDEIKKELATEGVARALLATTFKGLSEQTMRQAIMDGMIRGFTFLNFRQKDVYAIPYGQTYSLVTSIDYSRKMGMRSGIVGKEAPIYEMDGDVIVSCSVTVKRKIGEYVGDYTAKVYFNEYSTGKNLWISKPRTMIAKVAEMHALRMACPEELSKTYIEEEMELEDDRNINTRIKKVERESDSLKMGSIVKNEGKNNKKETKAKEEDQDEALSSESMGLEE